MQTLLHCIARMMPRFLLKKNDSLKTAVLSIDGTYRSMTLPHLLYHELSHAKDGFNTEAQIMRYREEVKGHEFQTQWERNAALGNLDALEALREKSSSIVEYPVIAETNHFMKKYYDEIPRALHHNKSREITPGTKITGETRSQPGLFYGIDYDQLQNLPIPTCKQHSVKGPRLRR